MRGREGGSWSGVEVGWFELVFVPIDVFDPMRVAGKGSASVGHAISEQWELQT